MQNESNTKAASRQHKSRTAAHQLNIKGVSKPIRFFSLNTSGRAGRVEIMTTYLGRQQQIANEVFLIEKQTYRLVFLFHISGLCYGDTRHQIDQR